MTLLKMVDIRKSFFGIEVLHCDELEIHEGEVHALMGENGAGKSTLVKVLMGEHLPDSGTIFIHDNQVRITSPAEALGLGIAKVNQELNPIMDMTVAENIFLGREPRKFGMVDQGEQNELAKELLTQLGLCINPKSLMRQLSIAEMQMVEIAKAVSYQSKILILDEPTSAITNNEIMRLFEIIRVLKKNGIGIIYITHKLDEIYKIADRVTVLRDGKRILTDTINDLPQGKLIIAMVGRELKDLFVRRKNKVGDPLLSVQNLNRKGKFENITFDVCRGEVLGLFGLMGSGRSEIFMALFGAIKADNGKVFINGVEANIHSPSNAIKRKIALLTEDRKLLGLNLLGSVQDNLMSVIQKRYSKFGFVNRRKSTATSMGMVKDLNIKTRSLDQITSHLSGGNQQKVVVGKWQLSEPDIILFDEPTRGVDVGAKAEIYKIITNLALHDKAIFLVSSELPEIIGMCDRVLVIKHGRIVGELVGEKITQEKLMDLAAN